MDDTTANSAPSTPVSIAIAWLIVGAPLLWGVWETVKKSMALFQ